MDATLKHNNQQVIFCDCDQDDCVQNWTLAGNWYEIDLLKKIEQLNVEGNYLDIGAYIGTFSLFASLFCPSENVYSIEPQDDIYAKLVKNIKINNVGKCKACNVAISDYNGFGEMTDARSNRGGSQLIAGNKTHVVRLDDLQLHNIKVIKIDVECSEAAVIRGGRQTISNAHYLFVEVWSEKTCTERNITYTGNEVADLLTNMGFVYQYELSNDNHSWKNKCVI